MNEAPHEVLVAEKATVRDEGDRNIVPLCGVKVTIAQPGFQPTLSRVLKVSTLENAPHPGIRGLN